VFLSFAVAWADLIDDQSAETDQKVLDRCANLTNASNASADQWP
jgi:hypothetical protein